MERKIDLRTGRKEWDELPLRIQSFLERSALDVVVDGDRIRGYRTPDAKSFWIRDFSDMLRGIRHIESDLTSMIDHFASTQAANGRLFDYFTVFPEKPPSERENWTKYVRVPVEADVEYRFVTAVFLAWQASGDDAWLKNLLPAMEQALAYIKSHPWRWDCASGLVKRAYTIDTWDFAYTAGKHDWLQFQIDDHTFWGIMHGDNSGYYHAFHLMARFYRHFEIPDRAAYWHHAAEAIKSALNRVCWNGRFYTHFVKLMPMTIPGVDESRQLSLSNPMNINRGTASPEMAASILEEYRLRGREGRAFAEWYSIDPPFPDGIFGDEKLVKGAYVNGGIMPLVGGELARAAFEYGSEDYGVDILLRYSDLIRREDSSFLWYFPDGTPPSRETSTSPEALPSDAWGSSAMLYALTEGLAGIVDAASLFRKIRLAPRWPAAGIEQAEIKLGYPASGAFAGYLWRDEGGRIVLEVESSGSDWNFHILLPGGRECTGVEWNGKPLNWEITGPHSGRYIDCSVGFAAEGTLCVRLAGDGGGKGV